MGGHVVSCSAGPTEMALLAHCRVHVPFQFRLRGEAVPEIPIEVDLFTGGQILTYEYRDMLKAGRVQGVLGSINHFVEDGIVLTNGTVIPADVVIYGTGFGKSYDIF